MLVYGYYQSILDHSMELPLQGVKVVELTLAIAGPSAGSTLADYGMRIAIFYFTFFNFIFLLTQWGRG